MLRYLLLLLYLSLGAHTKRLLQPIFGTVTDLPTDAPPSTISESWSSTPYCFGLTECVCEGDDVAEREIEEEECCPCVCTRADEGWCRMCICPRTSECQCVCNHPNASMTHPVTHTPPPISLLDVALAVYDLKDNVTACLEEINTFHKTIWSCFGEDNVKPFLNPVRNAISNALEQANSVQEILTLDNYLDNPELLRRLDDLAFYLRKAKEKLHEFSVAMAMEIAAVTGTSTGGLDFDNPDDMATILAAWNPDPAAESDCFITKALLFKWHPTFWQWSVWGGGLNWSLYHKLCFYWLCVLYIRVTLIVKVWWSWLWKPWEWLFPFFWCFWWPYIPFWGVWGAVEA